MLGRKGFAGTAEGRRLHTVQAALGRRALSQGSLADIARGDSRIPTLPREPAG